MRRSRQTNEDQSPRFGRLAIAVTFALCPVSVLAQASGANVVHGQASITGKGNQLTITTRNGVGTRHSAIDWQQFSVPQGGITRFNQPDSASTSINRVLGNDPSRIFGTLSSNGKLVLVNPAGITVGQGAAVDTAGFTASTLRMPDADALVGRLRFEGGVSGASLTVDGRVTAKMGDVVLIGPKIAVGSTGFLHALDGAVVLAAGQKVELTGLGLEGIRMEVIAPTDAAVNFGSLRGDAVGMFAGTLRHSGFIQADGAVMDSNKLRLVTAVSQTVDGVIGKSRPLFLPAGTPKDEAVPDDPTKGKAAKDKAATDAAARDKAAEPKTNSKIPATATGAADPVPAPVPVPSQVAVTAPSATGASSAPAPAPAPTGVPAAPSPQAIPVAASVPVTAPAPQTSPIGATPIGNPVLQLSTTLAMPIVLRAARAQDTLVISSLAAMGGATTTTVPSTQDKKMTIADKSATDAQCVP